MVGRGTDQRIDRLVQVTFQEQRPGARQTYPDHRTKRAGRIAHAKQLRHEMANIGTVGLTKTLLDKGFEGAPLRSVRQGPDEIHLLCFGQAKVQRQLNVPVEIGH
ncbi:hypothetical protein D3C81_1976550 [compost metagenome]